MILKNVVSNYALVLAEFVKSIQAYDTELSITYDPNLSFSDTITSARRQNQSYQTQPLFPEKEDIFNRYPIFAFKTSSVRLSDFINIKAQNFVSGKIEDLEAGRFSLFKSVEGEVTINFRFYTDKLPDSVNLQILWDNYLYINSIKKFNLIIPELELTLPYQIYWDTELTNNMDISLKNNVYQSIDGKCNIIGQFISFVIEDAYIVNEINAKIQDYYNLTLYEKFIVKAEEETELQKNEINKRL